MNCLLCGEDVPPDEAADHPMFDMDGRASFPHWYCMLREVLGGIGHHEDHEFWCLTMHEPDAGLGYRASARRVAELWVTKRGHL